MNPPRRDDIPALHALIESAYRGDSARRGWSHEADLLDGQRTDLASLAAMLADPAQHLLVLRDNDTLARLRRADRQGRMAWPISAC